VKLDHLAATAGGSAELFPIGRPKFGSGSPEKNEQQQEPQKWPSFLPPSKAGTQEVSMPPWNMLQDVGDVGMVQNHSLQSSG